MTALIVFGGLPGAGKTTIASRLAAQIGAAYLRIDVIEVALHFDGVEVERQGYSVANALARSNLKLGLTVVADAVNPVAQARDAWRAIAAETGARLVEVEVVCSDPVEHRRRVETRTSDIAGFVPPTWAEVVERHYQPWEGDRLLIDTAVTSVDEAVARIRGLLPVSPLQGHR